MLYFVSQHPSCFYNKNDPLDHIANDLGWRYCSWVKCESGKPDTESDSYKEFKEWVDTMVFHGEDHRIWLCESENAEEAARPNFKKICLIFDSTKEH